MALILYLEPTTAIIAIVLINHEILLMVLDLRYVDNLIHLVEFSTVGFEG